MASRDNQLVTYVTDAEKKQLEEWADETGKSLSALLREAVLEYTDHDRARRIEEKVDHLIECLDTPADGEHTHTKTTGVSRSVPEKARAVADHIFAHYDPPIKGDDVELAIENSADVGDERSVRKYKEQLKKRDLLFEHPHQPVWTDQVDEWVKWVEKAHVDLDPHEVTDDYGLSIDEYTDLVEEVVADA